MSIDKIHLGDHTDFPEDIRYDYPLGPTDTVLDIGSYRREFADRIIKEYGCKVECFDALDNRAAWLYVGKIAMGGNYLYTSALADNPDKEYWCVDINPYLCNVALVKMNIEGGEYELLRHMLPHIGEVKYLQVQFHLIDGMDCEKLYKDIATELSKTHKLMWRYPFVWESWERI